MNQSSRYPLFSGAGLLVLAILLLGVIGGSNVLLHGLRLDLTQNRVFTLSQGTVNILKQIGEPIDLYYFISAKTAQGVPQVNVYSKRVRDMLLEMAEKSDGKLKLHVIDPEPFSNEEDRAVELGLQGVPISDSGNLIYFGLAGSNAVGKTAAIPFFQVERQSLLEYDLSKLVFQLSRTKKSVVGVISSLDLFPGLDRDTKAIRRGTVVGQQLRQLFDIRELKRDVTSIPDDVELLMLVHPQDLPDATQYAIDQFVMKGGKVMAFVDPFSAVQGKAGTPDHPTLPESNPERLLKSWGVMLDKDEVVLDSQHALRITTDPAKPPIFHFAMLSLTKDVLSQDDVTTRGLDTINMGFAGALTPVADSGITVTPVITSGPQSMEYTAYAVSPSMDPDDLVQAFRSENKKHVIAARMTGTAHTAFPDGPPAALTESAAARPDGSITTQVKQSVKPISVMVVADTDILADRIWVEVQEFFGKKVATPWASNGDFVVSAVDNLLGSSDVISIRSRAGYSRPFERVDAIKRSADAKFRSKERFLQDRLKEAEAQLNQFQAQKSEGGGTILTPEQQQTLTKFREDKLAIRKQLREVRRQLDQDIENLGSWLKFINIGLMPLLLVLGVLLFNLYRWLRKPSAEKLA